MTNIDALSVIRDLLVSHNLEVARQDDILLVQANGKKGAVLSRVHVHREEQGYASIQLDVRVLWRKDADIIESFGGTGKNVNEAVLQALRKFSENSLHVLMAAVWLIEVPAHVHTGRWLDNDEIEWIVWQSNFLTQGIPDDMALPGREIPEVVQKLFKDYSQEEVAVWIRVFAARMPDGRLIVEVLRNNEPWESAQVAVKSLNWPNLEGYYSTRWFCAMTVDVDKLME